MFWGKLKVPFLIQTTICGADLAGFQQQSRQSTNEYAHYCGFTPLRSIKWPFVLSSSSEVKLSSATLNPNCQLCFMSKQICVYHEILKPCTFIANGESFIEVEQLFKQQASFFLFVTMFTFNYFYGHCLSPLKVADCFSRRETTRQSFCVAVISHQLALGTVLSTVPVYNITGDL